ncbi:MAG TPA: cyclic nucleotide-binding domain-containing protein, partial [Acidimicrobiales bacterium]|nr:cyclic nucleotide-binding domain-containing protein [Acidimicrobiales bacterium]
MDLHAITLFADLTDKQVSELADVGKEVYFDEGCVLFREGEPADFWWVLLDGRLELVRRSGHEESVVAVMEHPGVWAGGFRAWTDVAGYLATGRATTAGRMLRIPAPALRELMYAWSPLGVHLIAGFFETVRNLEARYRQHEALVALGTLAAGLAHEINNPASAATRSVDALAEACDTLLSSLVQLAEGSLRPDQFVAIDALRREIDPSGATSGSLAVADREDALSDWLSSHRVKNAWRIAPVLATAGVSVTWCDSAAEALPGSTLEPGLEWVASTLSIASLLSEMKESTRRISALVGAIKSYSQLDRASQQLVDVTEGIESTLVMLGYKLRDGVTVVRDYGSDLPRIEANPGELNQVWTNLIDNAIDA